MEWDKACSKKWGMSHIPAVEQTRLHTGDQNSTLDLDRVLAESGGRPFDLIIDDGSHINEHMINTLRHMIPHVVPGGL